MQTLMLHGISLLFSQNTTCERQLKSSRSYSATVSFVHCLSNMRQFEALIHTAKAKTRAIFLATLLSRWCTNDFNQPTAYRPADVSLDDANIKRSLRRYGIKWIITLNLDHGEGTRRRLMIYSKSRVL